MKTRKLNKRDKWKLCQIIWNMCLEDKIIVSDAYERYEGLARKILAKYPEILVDMLQPIKDLEVQFKFFLGRRRLESLTEQENNNSWALGTAIQALENVLNNHKPVFIKYEKPKRMVSPPFEAYYQVGHSALNVGPGRISDDQMRQMRRPYR